MLRHLSRALRPRETSFSPLLGSFGSSSNYGARGIMGCVTVLGSHRSIVSCSCKTSWNISCRGESDEVPTAFYYTRVAGFAKLFNGARLMSTQARVPTQGLRQGGLQVAMLSPGLVYEPYKPPEPIPFWRRWFTPSGWRRTKEDIVMELRSAYAITRLRKVTGYSKKQFYQEAIKLYKEINILLANGDRAALRKLVTENMFSAFKNELKRRETVWNSVYWELVVPVLKVRTLRARMIGVDKNNLDKAFVQLTIEFLTKQKFEAYDSSGVVVSGDKTKEILVRDIWVFERSLFHRGSHWRLCARISL